MPELPEIHAHARRLETEFAGTELRRFEPLSFTALKTFSPPPEQAHGLPLRRVGDRGKHLLLDFGDVTFVVHLMQGGRLRPVVWASTHLRVHFGPLAGATAPDG